MSKPKEIKTGVPPKLATEDPLAEKDEQAVATERGKKLAQEALEKWHRLKEKVKHPFKK